MRQGLDLNVSTGTGMGQQGIFPQGMVAQMTQRKAKNCLVPNGATKNEVQQRFSAQKRELNKTGDSGEQNTKQVGINRILSESQSYLEKLRTQREQSTDTAANVKKMKYQFKNLSSRILRSKTSSSAKQVVNQARREVLRLKRLRASEEEDTKELDAAIEHAKAMERVAKKKAKHLEEEEIAEAIGGLGGPCEGSRTGKNEESHDENYDKEYDEGYDEEYDEYDESYADGYVDNYNYESRQIEEMAYADSFDSFTFEGFSMSEYEMADLTELASDLFEDFSDDIKDMLEDLGLEELSESLEVYDRDMDPADLDMMKLKHRNKEMKEIVKADSEYLKVMSEQWSEQVAESSINVTV